MLGVINFKSIVSLRIDLAVYRSDIVDIYKVLLIIFIIHDPVYTFVYGHDFSGPALSLYHASHVGFM